MSIMPTYDFNAPDGSTHLALTAGQIHRQFVPYRSAEWVKRGLLAGARSLPELVAESEKRNRLGKVAALRGSKNSPMRGKY